MKSACALSYICCGFAVLGSGSGRMTMEKLSGILKCITENANVVGFTIGEYLPFDEHKMHRMFKDIKIFNG